MNQLLFSYLGFDLEAEEMKDLKGSCEREFSKRLQESFDRALQVYAESLARSERTPDLLEREEVRAEELERRTGSAESLPGNGAGTVRKDKSLRKRAVTGR